MANIGKILKDEMRRIARIEANAVKSDVQERVTKLHRQVKNLEDQVSDLERSVKTVADAVDDQAIREAKKSHGPRFTKRTIPSHRKRLGLTIHEFAKLIGVNHNSVYNWEHGRTQPRDSMIEKIDEVRKMGRREANRILEDLKDEDDIETDSTQEDES